MRWFRIGRGRHQLLIELTRRADFRRRTGSHETLIGSWIETIFELQQQPNDKEVSA